MARYRVFFTAEASYVVEVDADSPEDAEDRAYDEANFPYFSPRYGEDTGDLGEWYVKHPEDIEEIE